MLTIFSAFDERARPKGSRDPLGAEAVWSHLGRKLVGNLTTVTSSLDNFIVALLCCEFANLPAKDADVQERYLRCEQLGAYLRLAVRDVNNGLLGVSRARSNFAADKIRLGKDEDAQLLADQASYGLWGLYSTALDSVGLIAGDRRRPTAGGQVLLGKIVDSLGQQNWSALTALADADRVEKARIEALAPAFDTMLRDPALRAAVVEALLSRHKDCDLQGELYSLTGDYLEAGGATNEGIGPLCAYVLASGKSSPAIRNVMRQVYDIDPVLRRADLVMSWLQSRADTPLDELAALLAPVLARVAPGAAWRDLPHLPHRDFLAKFDDACAAGRADDVIQAVLAQNKQVMGLRGGAAWVEFDAVRRLVVRVRNDRSTDLGRIAGDDGGWHHSYFLASFLAISSQGRP